MKTFALLLIVFSYNADVVTVTTVSDKFTKIEHCIVAGEKSVESFNEAKSNIHGYSYSETKYECIEVE